MAFLFLQRMMPLNMNQGLQGKAWCATSSSKRDWACPPQHGKQPLVTAPSMKEQAHSSRDSRVSDCDMDAKYHLLFCNSVQRRVNCCLKNENKTRKQLTSTSHCLPSRQYFKSTYIFKNKLLDCIVYLA